MGSIFGIYEPAEECVVDMDDPEKTLASCITNVCQPGKVRRGGVVWAWARVRACLCGRRAPGAARTAGPRGLGRRLNAPPAVRSIPNPIQANTNHCNPPHPPLLPAQNLLAAGYVLYSSCTILVLTIGDGVYGFTLDPYVGEFVLTHDRIQVPEVRN